MANGSPYKMSEPALFNGSNCCLQFQGQGSLLSNVRGVEIRRLNKNNNNNQSVRCKLTNGETENAKVGKKMKRMMVDSSGRTNLQVFEPGAVCERVVSGKSVASPASNMDVLDDHEAEFEAADDDDDDELKYYRGLVLDLTFRPINVINWKRSLCLTILEKADVLEYYDQVVYSPNKMFFIPAVLKVNGYVHTPKHRKVRLSLNRANIFLRDKYRCQYCGSREDLTIDHVSAASRGGGWTWENLVTACSSCNVKKASKTVEEAHMTLVKLPKEPEILYSHNLPPSYRTFRTLKCYENLPPEWLSYLPNRFPTVQ